MGDAGLLDASLVKSGWRKPSRRSMLKRSDSHSDNSKLSESVRTKKEKPVVRPTAGGGYSPADHKLSHSTLYSAAAALIPAARPLRSFTSPRGAGNTAQN